MSKSLVASLCVSLVVALGIGTAWSTALVWVAAMIGSAMQGQGYELLYVSMSGEPVIVRMARNSAGSYAEQEVVNLAGRPVQVDTQQLLHPLYVNSQMLPDADGRLWQHRLAAVGDSRSPATYWYLVHDGRPNGRACGIGYHSRTRRVVGYFGTQGFSDHPLPPDQCFEVPGASGLSGRSTNLVQTEPYWTQLPELYVIANGKLWAIDPAKRSVRSLTNCSPQAVLGTAYVVPGINDVAVASRMRGNLSVASSLPQQLLLHEGRRVAIVDPETGTTKAVELPSELRPSMIAAFVLPNDELLALTIDLRPFVAEGMPGTQHALWFDRAGKVTREELVRTTAYQSSDPKLVGWIGVAAMPMPLSGLIFTALIPHAVRTNSQADSYGQALMLVLGQFWPSLLALLAIGAVTAVLAYRRQRRFGLPGAIAWAAFAFLLGIPGWIAYRFHRSWPVLEECPACQQPAPRDRDACTECGGEFPPPPLKGIEVFA